MNKTLLLIVTIVYSCVTMAQDVDKKIINWYNGKKFGMSTDLAYKKVLDTKKSTTVVVAVIDSGVDIEHEDLQGQIWVNIDEIPNNGIDDDKNGYVDDVNGWSFLGNKNGKDLNDETLEVTRLYKKYTAQFGDKTEDQISADNKANYALYQTVKTEFESSRDGAEKNLERYNGILKMYVSADSTMKAQFGGTYTAKDLKSLKEDEKYGQMSKMLYPMAKKGLGIDALKSQIQGGIDHFASSLNVHYNLDLDSRSIVGDEPGNFSDKYYGSNVVEGPDAFHGTHVAGIIAAVRGNGIGSDGVADNVKIMSVRAVPNGDERDKDVALAIRYAVDNGAQVINGSFGKSYSPYQNEVISAIKYAESKGVLFIHAAGNSSKDIGLEPNFPSPKYPSMEKEFSNWIEVGASTRYKKKLAASFSNYNNEMVDVFAPGLEIYATTPNNKYAAIQGTSMASPMVAGVAALLKSYYPSLTMFQIRDIIFESVQDIERATPLPGSKDEVDFESLSATGGIVNVYNAVLMAEEKTSKK